jgi:F-type H+-transporting ATPase subunit b
MANPNVADPNAVVAENLADATHATSLTERPIKGGDGLEGHTVATEEHVASPTALGFDSTGWVAIAALVVVLLMLWKKVPALIGGMLDTRIAAIRGQLDEAAKLRAEAEARNMRRRRNRRRPMRRRSARMPIRRRTPSSSRRRRMPRR